MQAALEDLYTEFGVLNLISQQTDDGEDERVYCRTYFECDVKRLSCDLWRTVERWGKECSVDPSCSERKCKEPVN